MTSKTGTRKDMTPLAPVRPGKVRRVRQPRLGSKGDDRLTVPDDPTDVNAAHGKPTNFKFEYLELTERLCMLGLTNRELAHSLGVSEETLDRWLSTYPEFKKAAYEGREGADALVARALFKRAIGYEHPEDDIKAVARGGNMGSEIVITPTVKRYAPDTGAASAWLAIRQKEKWKGLGGVGREDTPPVDAAAAVRDAIKAAMAEIEPQPTKDES